MNLPKNKHYSILATLLTKSHSKSRRSRLLIYALLATHCFLPMMTEDAQASSPNLPPPFELVLKQEEQSDDHNYSTTTIHWKYPKIEYQIIQVRPDFTKRHSRNLDASDLVTLSQIWNRSGIARLGAVQLKGEGLGLYWDLSLRTDDAEKPVTTVKGLRNSFENPKHRLNPVVHKIETLVSELQTLAARKRL